MTQLIWQFLCEVLSSCNPKRFCYSYGRSCSLCEGKASLCRWLVSWKLCGFFMFSTGFTSLCVTSFFTNIVRVEVSTPPPPPHQKHHTPLSLFHLMHVIARTHGSTHATSLMHVKSSTAIYVYDTYCLRHRNKKMKERTKTSNFIADHFLNLC